MLKVYVYVLDTMADWELGHVISELNSGRFFKKKCAARVTQNGWLFERAHCHNGRIDNRAGLPG